MRWLDQTKILLIYAISALLILCLGCAPVTYNRYQTAHTLGKCEMKLMVGANIANDLALLSTPFDLQDEMDDKLLDWSDKHPGNEDDVWEIYNHDFWEGFLAILSLGVYPDLELLYAIGVSDTVDVEARATFTGYFRLNTKIKLFSIGQNGALAISPGVGYRNIDDEQEAKDGDVKYGDEPASEDDNWQLKDKYEGYVITVELPVIIGWQFKHLSPYFAPVYYYNYMPIAFTRKISGLSSDFNETVDEVYNFHSIGLMVGLQIKLWKFLITPELVGVYHIPSGAVTLPGFIYPGLSIGLNW